jgi:hypothetical protein
MEAAPSTNGTNGRTTAGQFGPGNRFGKGNPRINRLAANHQALLDCLTADEVTALARRLYDFAMAGDVRAAEYLLNRLCGKPLVAVPPSEPESSEQPRVLVLDWTLKPEKAAELLEQVESGNTDGVCEMLRRHLGGPASCHT